MSNEKKILLEDATSKSIIESEEVFLGPYEASSHVMASSGKPTGGEQATLRFQDRRKQHLTASATPPNPLSLYSCSPQVTDDHLTTGVQWLKRRLSSDSEFQNVSNSIINTCLNVSSSVQWSIGGDESDDEELIDMNMNGSKWIADDAEDDAEHIGDTSSEIGSAVAQASGEFVDQNRSVENLSVLATTSSQNNPLHTYQGNDFINDTSMVSQLSYDQNKQHVEDDESTLDQVSSLQSDRSNSTLESNYLRLIEHDPLEYDPVEMSENDNTLKDVVILDNDINVLENLEQKVLDEVLNDVKNDLSPNQMNTLNDSSNSDWSRTFPDSTVISNKTNINSNISNINITFPSITQEISNTKPKSENVIFSFISDHYSLVASLCLAPILWSFMPGIVIITAISISAFILAFHGKLQG